MTFFHLNRQRLSPAHPKHALQGFTLVEVLIAMMILGMLITFASGVYLNFFNTFRRLQGNNFIYQESRFSMDRMLQEIESRAVDYEQYFNKYSLILGNPKVYGANYCEYSRQFYLPGPDGEYGTKDDINTGSNQGETALPTNIQDELYLINESGTERVYFKRLVGKDDGGNSVGQIGILELVGQDYGLDHLPADPLLGRSKDEGEGDGHVDTWLCASDFSCFKENDVDVPSAENFIPITPANLDVVDLKFIIAPTDDPRKGFQMNSIQIQPHVTVKLIVRPGKRLASSFTKGIAPLSTFESTISSQVYSTVQTECSLKECNDGDTKSCPLSQGVCTGATQTCAQNVWPGCTPQAYKAYASAIFGKDVYQANKETTCSDRLDNDCNGVADEFDSSCVSILCSNGILDTGLAPIDYKPTDDLTKAPNNLDPNDIANQDEKCKDVGGFCSPLHPHQPKGEEGCYDRVDNDCNVFADEFDVACINVICNNGRRDTGLASTDPLQARDYLIGAPAGIGKFNQDELGSDVGGLCADAVPAHPVENPNEFSCSDGLDNDLDGLIDRADPDCVAQGCRNGILDAGETCTDAGGVCGALVPETLPPLCSDSIDNDCNMVADWQDRNCCTDQASDKDLDGFKWPDLTCFPPPEKNDCDDTDNAVHPPLHMPALPSEIEQGNLCYDAKDNDCTGSLDDTDPTCCTDFDGDGFGDQTDVGGGVLQYNVASCPGTTEIHTILLGRGNDPVDIDPKNHPQFYSDCDDKNPKINPAIIDRCDDVIDNNCNGLADTSDHYCVSSDEFTFIDNLTSTDFRSAETSALWDGSGIAVVTPVNQVAPQVAVSKILPIKNALDCPGISSAMIHPEVSAPPGTSITYRLTNDEAQWVNANADQVVNFAQVANKRKLRWQAILQGDGISQSPELDSVTITYGCQ